VRGRAAAGRLLQWQLRSLRADLASEGEGRRRRARRRPGGRQELHHRRARGVRDGRGIAAAGEWRKYFFLLSAGSRVERKEEETLNENFI